MDAHRVTLTVTGALLLALLALGLSLQLGYRRHAARWPHHALYFFVVLGTALGLILALVAGRRGWALLPAALSLLAMPRTRPGRAAHWQLALAAAVAYALGAWGAW